MYRKCTTERSVRNQRKIENALLELMGKQPFAEISVTQICKEAEISRRIFYHLFGSKQNALWQNHSQQTITIPQRSSSRTCRKKRKRTSRMD